MALIELHFHVNGSVDQGQITQLITDFKNEIMASIAQLNEKITELETAWSTENQEISTKLTSLQDEVTRLREVIANQGTPEDIDAAIARIDAIITDVKDTVTEEPEQPQP